MIRVSEDVKLDYDDVMLVPRYATNGPKSRSQVDLLVPFANTVVVPVIAANMDKIGTLDMSLEMAKAGMMTALHKFYDNDILATFLATQPYPIQNYIYSIGANDDDFMKAQEFYHTFNDLSDTMPALCVDVANGYTPETLRFLAYTRRAFKQVTLIAGNVCTPDGVRLMAEAGVEIIKIGIGPGSACLTRRITGVGYPQFSAIMECSDEADRHSVRTIADGGVKYPGDVAKALAAGADFVMLGGYLAGHDECIPKEERLPGTTMAFRGMASKAAQVDHTGDLREYRASEGRELTVPRKGPVAPTLTELAGGLRSTCTYLGVNRLQDLASSASFVRVNNQVSTLYGR